jgi:O-antigen/teichoic acid export membrane protein
MSFKKNTLANFTSQIYVSLIGIVMVPMYIRYMGAEAYGLIGFFSMLQAWFQLLDIGLTPTMAREAACFRGGARDARSLLQLLRALEGIFVGIAILGAAAIVTASSEIAGSWLKVQHMSLDEVQRAIILMSLIVALRWITGLYRGVITGFERLVWLSGFNIAVSTARFVLVIPLFSYVGTSPTAFFSYQLALAVFEIIVLVLYTYRILPRVTTGKLLPWQWAPLCGVLKFSLSIAFTGSVWVLVTQTDKLVLSKLLSLTDFAYFTLAVLVASGVSLISAPINGPLLPRLTKLSVEGDDAGVILLYRKATQLIGMITIPASLVLAFFAEQVLWAWTGNAEIAHKAAPVLALYALGNGILALGAFPYYLQFAKGDLRLHLIGSALFMVLLIPALLVSTRHYGIIGAGYAWLGTNTAYFLFWVPMVHRKFHRGLHISWLLRDVGPIFSLTLAGAALVQALVKWPNGRATVALYIALVSFALLAIAIAGSSWARKLIHLKLQRRFVG